MLFGYNLPGIKENLILTRENLVAIYNGTITCWNHTSIAEINPNISLPNEKILVLVRGDSSGTTEILTTAFSSFDAGWASQYGVFKKRFENNQSNWNESVIHLAGVGTRGMSGLLLSIPYTIGYISTSEAANSKIQYASLYNQAGKITSASPDAIQSAMNSKSEDINNEKLTADLSDAKGINSYPVAGYTYFIIRKRQTDNCQGVVELVRYCEWFLTSTEAHEACLDNNMVPITDKISAKIIANVLMEIECNSELVWDIVKQQKYNESLQDQQWRVPVYILSSLLIVAVLSLTGFLIYKKVKRNILLAKNEWNIDVEEIIFFSAEKTGFGQTRFVDHHGSSTGHSVDETDGYQTMNDILQWPGKFKHYTVGLRLIEIKHLQKVQPDVKKILLKMKDCISHTNITKFHGLILVENSRYVVSEYCSKGSINEFLRDGRFKINNDVKLSLASDIAQGLHYLHSIGITHGHLKSSSCLIDFRWTVKISDWEYCKLYSVLYKRQNPHNYLQKQQGNLSSDEFAVQQFWIAPELIKSFVHEPIKPNFSTDVYSFSIILQEIFTRKEPYEEHIETHTNEELVKAILYNNLRPRIDINTPTVIADNMENSWSEHPMNRPSIEHWLKCLRNINTYKRTGMLDSMMETLEIYAAELEMQLQQNNESHTQTNQQVQKLKQTTMPRPFWDKFISTQSCGLKVFRKVGIVVFHLSDLQKLNQENLRTALACIQQWDSYVQSLTDQVGAFKQDIGQLTIMILTDINENKKGCSRAMHDASKIAVEAMGKLEEYHVTSNGHTKILVKCGIHLGTITVTVFGATLPRTLILGPDICDAVTICKASAPEKILVSGEAKQGLQNQGYSTKPSTLLIKVSKTVVS